MAMSPQPFASTRADQAHKHRVHFVRSSQVLSVGQLFDPNVYYSFNVPIEDRPPQFYWNSHGPWQACSKPCQGRSFLAEFGGCEVSRYCVHFSSFTDK